MAEITINPFGVGGETPTNIGIVNDLDTGGADKALSAEQGKLLGNAAKTGMYMADGEDGPADVDITFEDGDIVSGARLAAQPGGIAAVTQNTQRATINKVYYCGEGDAPSGTEKFDLEKFKSFYVPSGFSCSPTFATSVEQNATAIYPSGWANGMGLVDFEQYKDQTEGYPYLVFNFRYYPTEDTIGTSDIATLVDGFKLTFEGEEVEPVFAQHKALSIVDEEGDEVFAMSSPSATEGGETEIYSKDAIDEMLQGVVVPSNRIIRVAAWNFGHFCLGISDATSINNSNYDAKLNAWAKAINEIGATILCAAEYDPTFGSHTVNGSTVSENTNDVLMSLYYAANSVGAKSTYNCNGIFGKLAVSNGATVNFSGSTRYYQKATVTIGGKAVTIVAAHLELPGDAQDAQLAQLITDFANTEYVIIAGDFNVRRGEEGEKYGDFATAGFKLANCGDFGGICTYPSTGAIAVNTNTGTPYPYKYLDNIIVKGFNISNVHIFDEGTLTDHCAIIADLTMV